MEQERREPPRVVGRYAIYDAIAAGGMATVHIGRLIGPIGFSRTVAIKRLNPEFAMDPEFTQMLLDEARVASRIRHPNVVPVIDVVAEGGELLLVMEYVHGESLSFLLRAHPQQTPERTRVVANIVAGALHGLHAAHEATGDGGEPLGIVHRDATPQNVLLGIDGIPRVLDFGVAKAAGQVHNTGSGRIKGKIRYLAPEQIERTGLDRRADIWSVSVMLWESLTGQRLFTGDNNLEVMKAVLGKPIRSPREVAPYLPEPLARAVMRGLMRDPAQRFETALQMARALEEAVGLVSPREVGAWVDRGAHERLESRRRRLIEVEAGAVTAGADGPPSAQVIPVKPSTQEPTATHRAPHTRARFALLSVGAALVVATTVLAVHEGGSNRDAAASAPPASAPLTSAPPASAPSASAPSASAPSASAPSATPTASSAVSAAPSASALVQRGTRAPVARPKAASSTNPDFRVPLYGRD